MSRRKRILWFIAFLAIPILLVGFAAVIAANRTPTDDPVDRDTAFPGLEGTNLLMETVSVPDDLPGDLKLIVVAYDTDQQPIVDKWLLPLEELQGRFPQLAGYYVPLLPQSASDASLFIISGMTLAAQNDTDRARTAVVFTDVEAFNQLVEVPDTSAVQLFLLDTQQKIRWHGSGSYQYATLAALEAVLTDLTR